jgi:hypothetical protein
MTRSKLFVVAFGLAGLASFAGIGAKASTGPALIRITDVETSVHTIQPAGGGWAGAVQVISQRLYNPALSQQRIGVSQLVCTFADKRDRTCIGSYELPRGTIVVTGPLASRLLYEIPIVGGTGLYDNARGTLTVTASRFRPRHEVLLFRLLG